MLDSVPAFPVPGGLLTSFSPGFELLLAGVGIEVALLYRRRPPVTWETVFALVPWLIAGSALRVLGAIDAYPASIAITFDVPAAYLTAFLIAGLAWVVMLELSTAEASPDAIPTYVGAMGIGTALVLVPVVIWQGGVPAYRGFVWLVTLPIAAAATAFVVVFLFGFWHPDAAAYAGFAGGLVVFGHALDGLATVVNVVAIEPGGHTSLTRFVADAVVRYPVAESTGLDPAVVWPPLFVWVRIAVAVVVVALYAPYVREHPTRGNVVLGLVAAIGLAAGTTRLLLIAIGG